NRKQNSGKKGKKSEIIITTPPAFRLFNAASIHKLQQKQAKPSGTRPLTRGILLSSAVTGSATRPSLCRAARRGFPLPSLCQPLASSLCRALHARSPAPGKPDPPSDEDSSSRNFAVSFLDVHPASYSPAVQELDGPAWSILQNQRTFQSRQVCAGCLGKGGAGVRPARAQWGRQAQLCSPAPARPGRPPQRGRPCWPQQHEALAALSRTSCPAGVFRDPPVHRPARLAAPTSTPRPGHGERSRAAAPATTPLAPGGPSEATPHMMLAGGRPPRSARPGLLPQGFGGTGLGGPGASASFPSPPSYKPLPGCSRPCSGRSCLPGRRQQHGAALAKPPTPPPERVSGAPACWLLWEYSGGGAPPGQAGIAMVLLRHCQRRWTGPPHSALLGARAHPAVPARGEGTACPSGQQAGLGRPFRRPSPWNP
ncbi:translation initiation factor IF-2-like, partial [Varanus komodoensis]|uniref:translation initiation factor IF-2-like n=1 Tax=Varanus komodoensis TaxID=61221 RepID=UPI001CF7B4BD